MPTVSNEAFLAWTFLFVSRCFVHSPWRVSANFESEFDGIIDEEEPQAEFMPVKFRGKLTLNPGAMTCNCSWGTVMFKQKSADQKSSSRYETEVSGGRAVNSKEHYPMVGNLHNANTNCMVCAATIVTEYHAITTAQCAYDFPNLILAVGARNSCKKPNDGVQYIRIMATYAHEDYISSFKENDIALVVTDSKIVFSDYAGPACIHTEQICNEKDPILVLGWGKILSYGAASPSLLKIFVEAVEPTTCKKLLGSSGIHNLNLRLCTVSFRNSACPGDSGSPLFMVDHSLNRIALIGIMSSGTKCGKPDLPSTTVAIHPYLGWLQWTIEKSMKKHHPKDYARCDSSFCFITDPQVS